MIVPENIKTIAPNSDTILSNFKFFKKAKKDNPSIKSSVRAENNGYESGEMLKMYDNR